MRIDDVTMASCTDLHVVVIEQQAGNVFQLELARRLQAVMAVHDGQTGAFKSNRNAPELFAQNGISQGYRVVRVMAFIWSNLFDGHKIDRKRSEERRVGKECRSRWWAGT